MADTDTMPMPESHSEISIERAKSAGAGEMVSLSIRTLDKKEFHLQVKPVKAVEELEASQNLCCEGCGRWESLERRSSLSST